jgi:hypothetical protein
MRYIQPTNPSQEELLEAMETRTVGELIEKYSLEEVRESLLQKGIGGDNLIHRITVDGDLNRLPKELLTLETLLEENNQYKNCFDMAGQYSGFQGFPSLSKKELESLKDRYRKKKEKERALGVAPPGIGDRGPEMEDLDRDDPTQNVLNWVNKELTKAKKTLRLQSLQALQRNLPIQAAL